MEETQTQIPDSVTALQQVHDVHVDESATLTIYSIDITIGAEHQETPPKPSTNVPFPRDRAFINRDVILHDMFEKGSASASKFALCGFGGVGKSQLAIEYCYQIRTECPGKWVFWIHASNSARFEQSFRDIADLVKLPGRNDPKKDIYKLLHNWLRDDCEEDWIIILDNVDDDQFLREVPTGQGEAGVITRNTPLLEYFPPSNSGSVIMTTRDRAVASRFTDESNIISVDVMPERDAVSLLKKKLMTQVNNADLVELAKCLGSLPLALDQAAAYINRRMRLPPYSVHQYLEEATEGKRMQFLDADSGSQRRDWESRKSVGTTLQNSFDHIKDKIPKAADMLTLMSFFDREGIPKAVIQQWYNSEDDFNPYQIYEEESSDDGSTKGSTCDTFEDSLLTLMDYFFITASEDGKTFQMHKLVQLAISEWTKLLGQTEKWKEIFVHLIDTHFPGGGTTNWAKCGFLLPHLRSVAKQQLSNRTSLKQQTIILHKAAFFMSEIGKFSQAEKIASIHFLQRLKLLGIDSLSTFSGLGDLATNIRGLVHLKDAEALYTEIINARNKILGRDDQRTLNIINNMAWSWKRQGRREDAIALLGQCVTLQREILGANHLDTLACSWTLVTWQTEHLKIGSSEDQYENISNSDSGIDCQ
ncbi:hypothetical protein N7456_007208 [Penicillium angulare]|uniref:NB-ARC domain-containing protein n=1 Tax=Penicillium angulare TaxID=116970 RepID=A0A9W9FJ46_9EURO|nr:hypothetical protein N7456_007208 [Penicillium angulare]